MKKFKMAAFTFLLAGAISCIATPILAKEVDPDHNYQETCVKDIYRVEGNYNTKYEELGYVTLKADAGYWKVIGVKEGTLDDDENFTPLSTVESVNVNDLIGLEIGSLKSQNPSFKVAAYKGEDTNRALRIELELIETDKYCMSKSDYEKAKDPNKAATVVDYYVYIDLIDYENTTSNKILNTNYDTGYCKALRERNSNGAIPSDIWDKWFEIGEDYYQRLAGYCWNREVLFNYSESQIHTMVENAITSYYALNTIKTAPSLDFQQAFDATEANARRLASLGGDNVRENISVGTNSIRVNSLKCDYQKLAFNTEATSTGSNDYKYVNKTSYFGSQKTEVVRKYKDENGQSYDKHICDRTCKEAVDVEYGPPETAIAGFCVQYQVKVTSRVICTSTIETEPPVEKALCQPRPTCNHSEYKNAMTQAGPSDAFDSCIYECDGGKYTQSCSKTCYNKVYGTNSTSKQLSLLNGAKANAQFVAYVPQERIGGRYERDTDGNIIWVSGYYKQNSDGTKDFVATPGVYTYAQWYIDHDKNLAENDNAGGSGYFAPDPDGFKRKYINNKDACGGTCNYVGCGPNTYLNEEDAAEFVEETNQYNSAIAECAALATCSTRTSYYYVSADYYDSANKKQTVKFPSDSDVTLTSNSNTNVLSQDSTITGENGFAGCYKGAEKNLYFTEWGFYGTWVNNKTGEISFTSKVGDRTWHRDTGFCLPLNSGNVNEDWYKWYMSQRANIINASKNVGDSDVGSYTNSENVASDQEKGVNLTTAPLVGPKEYNIHFSTYDIYKTDEDLNSEKGFGYFGWQFNIDCFYGSFNDLTSGEGYTTRTVSKDHLFPTTDPSGINPGSGGTTTTTGGTTSQTGGTTEVGRTPGFNWTQAATITSTKNENYAIDPSALISQIQGLGDTIYTEEDYLDYHFRLSRQNLRDIRSYNRQHGGYTNWEINDNTYQYDSESNMFIYSSPLFRKGAGDPVIKEPSVRKLGKLGCNNQLNENACGGGR